MKKALPLILALVALIACSTTQTERYGSSSDGVDDCTGGTVAGSGGSAAGSGGDAGSSGAGASMGGAGASGAAGSGGSDSGSGGLAGSAGASAGNGGASGASGAAGSAGSAGTGGASPTCDLSAYTPGVWRQTVGQPLWTSTPSAHGIAIDPTQPGKLWVTVRSGSLASTGLYRSTNCGATWTEFGSFDRPLQVRLNPANTQEMYVVVGASTPSASGVYFSSNGGTSWTDRSTWSTAVADLYDAYSISVDPTNFAHALVSFHRAGINAQNAAGLVETFNKGATWREILPISGWSGQWGGSIAFLYNPATGQGNAATWLYTTPGGGYWRTTDSAATWTKVSTTGQAHGGATLYYASNGTAYVGATPYPLKSNDNGATWAALSSAALFGNHQAVGGDGTNLWAAKWAGGASAVALVTSTEASQGASWTATGITPLGGAYEFSAVDPVNRMLYAGMWEGGVWAMKLP